MKAALEALGTGLVALALLAVLLVPIVLIVLDSFTSGPVIP